MDNWKEYKIPSHHVISVKLDPETGGVTAIVDIERVVKSIRQETIKRVMEVLKDEQDDSDPNAFPELGSDHSYIRNCLRQELRDNITKW